MTPAAIFRIELGDSRLMSAKQPEGVLMGNAYKKAFEWLFRDLKAEGWSTIRHWIKGDYVVAQQLGSSELVSFKEILMANWMQMGAAVQSIIER